MTLNLIQDPKKVLSTLFQFLEFKFAKIFLLKAYIAIHRVDIICISETYLDSNNSPDVTIWKYPVIIWYCLIILQTINEDVFVYIINIFYLLWEFSLFNICKNVFNLKWKLATKFATLYLVTDLPVKHYKTWNLVLKLWIKFRKYSL